MMLAGVQNDTAHDIIPYTYSACAQAPSTNRHFIYSTMIITATAEMTASRKQE